MKITASYEGLTRIENGDYVLEKDLIVDGSIEIELDDRFVVKGRLEASKSIIAKCGSEAGDGIEAKTIDCKKRIFAGISLYKTLNDCIKTIKCQKLICGEIAYGDLIIETEDK
jgi:hypothetical protein